MDSPGEFRQNSRLVESMPRKKIELARLPESLQILDPTGHVDTGLEPELPAEDLKSIYRWMLLTREFDLRMFRLQRQGRIGTFPPVQGQEAAHVASVFVLEPSDWLVPSFRETGAMLMRGWTMEEILLFYAGYEEGSVPSQGARNLPICVPVTSQLPHAVGLAWAAKLKGDSIRVLCYLGDGATSEGDFHEAMNFASVYQLPVVFLCQNNQWAISLPLKRQTRSRTLAQKALAYEMPGIQVDGNDPLAVLVATREALQRAGDQGGPTFIEALTYRVGVHTTADDPRRYRTDEEVAEWEAKDPLKRFFLYLSQKGVLDEAGRDALIEEVRNQTLEAVQRAESMMQGNPLDFFDYVYAESPPELLRQRRELELEIQTEKENTEPAQV